MPFPFSDVGEAGCKPGGVVLISMALRSSKGKEVILEVKKAVAVTRVTRNFILIFLRVFLLPKDSQNRKRNFNGDGELQN